MTPLELQARVEQLELENASLRERIDWHEKEAMRAASAVELLMERAEKAERERDEAFAKGFDRADESVHLSRVEAENAALREKLRVAREALEEIAGTGDREAWNPRARAAAALAATEEKRPLPPGVVRSEGFDGQPEVLRETRAATEEKP